MLRAFRRCCPTEIPAGWRRDVDGKDLTGLISEFGRTNCSPCKYDLDTDGDVDLADLFLFSEDFGRVTP